jgi:hypothetical protein
MDKKLTDLYTTFLMASTGQIACTALSKVLDGAYSHDSFTRFLSERDILGSDLWAVVKPKVRLLEKEAKPESEKCLLLDDHIEEKAYMEENDLIAWHYAHSLSRSVKGINQMSIIYHLEGHSIPLSFDFILKTEAYFHTKSGKMKRRSAETKNEKYRKLIQQAVDNQVDFEYVLNDIWFASAKNMNFVKKECKKDFIMPLKSNRKIALSLSDKQAGVYQVLSQHSIGAETTQTVYLEGLDFPVLLVKQVFKNKDGSEGVLYLVSSREGLDFQQITTIYQIRWKVEEHHKSIKSLLNYAKSPAHSLRTQRNHCILCLFGFFEWECMAKQLHTNHFALKAKIYIHSLKSAWEQIVRLKTKITIA